MGSKRVPQSSGLLIFFECRSEERNGEWVAFCDSLGVSDQGRTLQEAKTHLRHAMNLFLRDCSERGVLEEVLEARQVPHAPIQALSAELFRDQEEIQVLADLTADPDKPTQSLIERLRVIVPAVKLEGTLGRSGAD